jgi:hypothetical protein
MTNWFNVVGLSFSSVGALWLLIADIAERGRRTAKQQKLADMASGLEALKRTQGEVIASLRQTNQILGRPPDDRVDALTADLKTNIDNAERELSSARNSQQAVLDDILPLSHLGALALLLAGFLFQLVGAFVV